MTAHDESRDRRRKRVVALLTGLALLGVGGVGYAFWTGGGAGSGTAVTDSTQQLVVNQTSTLSPMYPGDSPQTLSGDFDNPNPGLVHVSAVTVSISSVTPSSTCSAADYTLTGATMPAVQDVPSGTAQGSWSGATIGFHSTASNQDACKGATVHLAYTVT